MDILMVPPNMKFCKLDYTILEDNILHLCSELNFVDIKTLKFPMCNQPIPSRKPWDINARKRNMTLWTVKTL